MAADDRQEGGDHYKKCKIQPWAVVEDWQLDYWLGNLIKYIFRASQNAKEAPLMNLKKGAHYLEKRIELEEEEEGGFRGVLMAVVTQYTTGEGGQWYNWRPEWGTVSLKALNDVDLNKHTSVQLVVDNNYIEVHVIKTVNGDTWDCLNGWRK